MTATNLPDRAAAAAAWRTVQRAAHLVTWCAALVALLWCVPAAAQGPADEDRVRADALFQEAVGLFEAEQFLEAAALMVQAFELDPNPRLAFNVARAFERGGNLDEALTYYWISADAPGDPELVTRAEESIQRVQDILNASRLMPTAPPETTPAPSNATTTSEPSPATPPASVVASVPPTPMSPQTSRRLRISGYTLLGVGAGLAGVGALTAIQSQNRYDEALSLGQAGVEAERFTMAVDAGKQNQLLSTVAYGVGIAALVSGVTVLVVERIRREDPDDGPRASAWHVGPGAGACQTMLCVGAGLEF